jgi:cyclophilin family peptidyl-prolyl cis-trans isomerase
LQQNQVARRCTVEPLEKREFLTLTVTSMLADNRGSVQVTLGGDADPATVHRTSVQVYTTGPDGKIYTADDVFVPSAVRYYANIRRISINFDLPSNTQYRVKLVSSRIKELGSGDMLDGEYNNTFPTGNGIPGGNTEFTVLHDRSATPIVRMSTSMGVITLKVFRGLKPNTAAQFLGHVNAGDYDNIFITRKIDEPFLQIIQTGSLKIDANGTVTEPNPGPAVANEFTTNGVIHNTRGTLAFAKAPNNPDSATNQFFFNRGDNSANLDGQNGGFTVFAQTANANSLAVLDAINQLETVVLHNTLTGNGALPDFNATDVSDVPVNDKSKYDGHGSNEPIPPTFESKFVVYENFNASTDTVVIGRTSMLYLTRSLTAK